MNHGSPLTSMVGTLCLAVGVLVAAMACASTLSEPKGVADADAGPARATSQRQGANERRDNGGAGQTDRATEQQQSSEQLQPAPDWTDVATAIASVFGAAFTALGFYFVVGQLRAARKQLTISTFEHLYARMQGIHEQFLSAPELRPYFYSGKTVEPNDTNAEKVTIAAEMLADFFQQVHLQLDLMPPKTAQGWRAYAADIVDKSPALRDYLIANEAWYPSGLLMVAKSGGKAKWTGANPPSN